MKSQDVNFDVQAFCALHEMHTQFRNKMVDGRNIIKYFGCCSFKPTRGAKQIAPASKNKWTEDWYRYWFYHVVSLVEEKDESRKIVKRYPLAAKMSKNIFNCKLDFPSSKNSKSCEKAYKLLVCKALVISAKNILQLMFGPLEKAGALFVSTRKL